MNANRTIDGAEIKYSANKRHLWLQKSYVKWVRPMLLTMISDATERRHVAKARKVAKKVHPPLPSSLSCSPVPAKGPVLTSTKQSMTYFTVKGIESEISILEPLWPIFALKELLDNAWDWLNDFYPSKTNSKQTRRIGVRIWWTDAGIHIAVSNSNIDNIRVFQNLDAILDYSRWVSTKRYQHRGTSGSRGDFLKRGLGMGYASWTSDGRLGLEGSFKFEDLQWDEPLILRFNSIERKAHLVVDMDNQEGAVTVSDPIPYKDNNTEVELVLPKVPYTADVADKLEEYYKKYKIGKPNIDFSFDVKMELSS